MKLIYLFVFLVHLNLPEEVFGDEVSQSNPIYGDEKIHFYGQDFDPKAGPLSIPIHSRVGLRPGQKIVMYAEAKKDAVSFEINLLADNLFLTKEPAFVPLHIKAEYSQKSFKFNSMITASDQWQKELRYNIPDEFTPEKLFHLVIKATEKAFIIIISGTKFYSFPYRMPLSLLNHVQINGDITVHSLNLGDNSFLHMPFSSTFVTGYFPVGKSLTVYGALAGDYIGVWFNTTAGDIGFFYSLRLKENIVVMNNMIGDKWQNEIRYEATDYRKNSEFILSFKNTQDKMLVFANGVEKEGFPHKVKDPNHDYVGFMVNGEIEVDGISEQNYHKPN